jgi:hypothetical protein
LVSSRNYLGSNGDSVVVLLGRRKVLYTASVSVFKKTKGTMKPYYLMRNHGNDAVIPDQSDLDQYRSGLVTWEGLKVNYLAKLMRPEAGRLMKQISAEAGNMDVVLVSNEEDAEKCYRILLAEMVVNMFSGQMDLHYGGELKQSS